MSLVRRPCLQAEGIELGADDVQDYLNRAVDSNGERLPVGNIVPALTVAAGAGFTTTSSLLSWLVYGLVAYDGMQARLLQELVDHDFTDDTTVTPELLEDLPMLDKFIKEMQRRHNPSYQPGRTAQRDLILPGGYKVPKGTVIIVALHQIHMNPKVWYVQFWRCALLVTSFHLAHTDLFPFPGTSQSL